MLWKQVCAACMGGFCGQKFSKQGSFSADCLQWVSLAEIGKK